jgi:hypothetical protein
VERNCKHDCLQSLVLMIVFFFLKILVWICTNFSSFLGLFCVLISFWFLIKLVWRIWDLHVCFLIYKTTYWSKEIWINTCLETIRNVKIVTKGLRKQLEFRSTITTCSWDGSTIRTTTFSSEGNSTSWCS